MANIICRCHSNRRHGVKNIINLKTMSALILTSSKSLLLEFEQEATALRMPCDVEQTDWKDDQAKIFR